MCFTDSGIDPYAGVSMENPGVFTHDAETVSNVLDWFTSDDDIYSVVVKDRELALQ